MIAEKKMIGKDSTFLILGISGGLVIDAYENETMFISCISTIDRFVGNSSVELVQKDIKKESPIFEFYVDVDEAEALLKFLERNYEPTKNDGFSEGYSKINFYYQFGKIWCEVLVNDDVKSCDVPYLIDELFIFEYGKDQLKWIINNLERAIEMAKKDVQKKGRATNE